MKFIPQPHQVEMRKWLKSHKRCALFSFMGSGKTVCVISSLMDLARDGELVFPALIIAPTQVAKSTWQQEFAKWDDFDENDISLVLGSPKARTAALDAKKNFYVINYENLPWLIEHVGKKWPFKTVIADESTRLKGFRTRQGSVRAKALAKASHCLVDRMILLTGTPAPKSLLDLWGQVWFIDKGERLGVSFSRFQERWFDSDYMGYSWTPKSFAAEQIQSSLMDICLTVKAQNWYPTDTPITIVKHAILDKKAEGSYKKMEKEMFLELESGDIEAFNAASKSMKCRQIAAGALYDESAIGKVKDYAYTTIHDEKIEVLKNIIAEHEGHNILVAYHFKSDEARILKALPNCATLSQPGAVDKWNAGEFPVMLVNPASAGVGLNLQYGGNIIVFFTSDWNLENHIQMIERIGPTRQRQAGKDCAVFVYYIHAKDTIDELVHERLTTKKEVQEILLEAMNRFKSQEGN